MGDKKGRGQTGLGISTFGARDMGNGPDAYIKE